MSKLPAFQFYPSDWRNDIKVQSLSFMEKGIWFEMLCLMHESDDRGKLVINGKPMDEPTVARLIGCDKNTFQKVLTKLLATGVAYKTEDGVIYNKRMVNDHKLIQVRRECGKRGGNPNLVNQKSNQQVKQNGTKVENLVNQNGNQKPTPSFASSSSSSLQQLSREKVFEVFRTNTDRKTITDDQIKAETEDFVKKYEGKAITSLPRLLQTWIERIEPKADPTKIKISLK